MTRRLFSVVATLFVAIVLSAQSQVKYVFYFIGDGMGVNQINVTETYLAALKGKIAAGVSAEPEPSLRRFH